MRTSYLVSSSRVCTAGLGQLQSHTVLHSRITRQQHLSPKRHFQGKRNFLQPKAERKPRHYWSLFDNQRTFLDSVGITLKIVQQSDWKGKLSLKSCNELGGGGLLTSYYD